MISNMKPRIEGGIFFRLTEEEARALKAITVYGYESFVDIFFKHLGRVYLEPHLVGLKSLFKGISDQVSKDLSVLERSRNYMKAELKKDPRY